ncbi:MAG TPA: hypothetical protein DCX21_07255 [Eubacterium sp.]|nr:hypothetical protein [Eubacterium sp.]HBZ53663.1 hypothetical protein [Eubacterium sp.]
MKRVIRFLLVCGIILVIIGGIIGTCAFSSLGFDVSKLDSAKYRHEEYEIDDKYSSIYVKTTVEDVEIVVGDSTKIVWDGYENSELSYEVVDDKLAIEVKDGKQNGLNIGFHTNDTKLVITIPEDKYKDIDFDLTTGDVEVENLKCESLTVKTNTGDVYLRDLLADKKISVKGNTGDVDLKYCDSDYIYLKTNTGDVTATLLTYKEFSGRSNTGDVRFPKPSADSIIGVKGKCIAETNTGDVNVGISNKE